MWPQNTVGPFAFPVPPADAAGALQAFPPPGQQQPLPPPQQPDLAVPQGNGVAPPPGMQLPPGVQLPAVFAPQGEPQPQPGLQPPVQPVAPPAPFQGQQPAAGGQPAAAAGDCNGMLAWFVDQGGNVEGVLVGSPLYESYVSTGFHPKEQGDRAGYLLAHPGVQLQASPFDPGGLSGRCYVGTLGQQPQPAQPPAPQPIAPPAPVQPPPQPQQPEQPQQPPKPEQPNAPTPPVPAPAACAGIDFALGLPLVGSEDWCTAEQAIITTIRDWGLKLLDWLIGILDKVEKYGWDGAHAQAPDFPTFGGSGGILGGNLVGSALTWLQEAINYVWVYAKKGTSWVVFSLAYGAKAVLCMLRNAQAKEGYFDYQTYVGLWIVRYSWKTLKQIRLSSPDFLGVQTVGVDIEDYFDSILDVLEKSLTTMVTPTVADAMEAFLNNRISESQYKCWLQLHDHSPAVWKPVLDSRREQLTTDEMIDQARRASMPSANDWHGHPLVSAAETAQEQQWQESSLKNMRTIGWLYQEDAAPRYQLYDELPTIGDHLHWLARNVDDAEYVKDYHLLDGFDSPEQIASAVGDPSYQAIPASKSRNFWAEFGAELRAQGMRKLDAARHYAAHWLHGSPQQLREFVYRLRPDRPFSEQDKVTKATLQRQGYSPALIDRAMSFTADDFRRILAEQDYGYLDTAWFLGTLYHVPALSYIRDMYRYGIIDEKELAGYHQDLGYTALDSERFVGIDRAVKARLRRAESFGWTPAALSRAYGLGLIDSAFYKDQMTAMGFNADETAGAQDRAGKLAQERLLTRALGRVINRVITQVTASYAQGVLDRTASTDALTKLGVPAAQISGILDMEQLKLKSKLVSELVRTVRGYFLKGKVDEARARELLNSVQVSSEFLEATIAIWKAEQLGGDKQATLADIKRWVVDGLISPEEAQIRMHNLKIADSDAQLFIAELQQRMAVVAARAAAQQQRATDKANRQLEQAAQEAARAARAALEQLMKDEPPAKLLLWLEQGIIGEAAYTERMTSYGYDAAAIRDNVASAAKRAKSPLLP